MEKEIKRADFFKRYKPTGNRKQAIFTDRKALMSEVFNLAPIYCNQSYYTVSETLYLVERDGEHFTCDTHKQLEYWRECHYYEEYEDANGNKVWLMEGGSYD